MKRHILIVAALTLLATTALPVAAGADSHPIDPPVVSGTLVPGGTAEILKTVTTPAIPPIVEVCLLEDETGSFFDDIANLQNPTTIAAIYDGVVAGTSSAEFAVSGFRDYPVSPYGSGGDWVYRSLSTMSPSFTDWENGVNALTAGGGADLPEAQYDAIMGAIGASTFGEEPPCGFSDPLLEPNVARVLVVATDAAFHTPDGTHQTDQAGAIAALNAADVAVVGLKAPGAGGELDALAAATGGSVQALSSDGANIAAAIIAGLSNLPVTVSMTSDCELPITTTFSEPVDVTSGEDAEFTETITVAEDADPGTYECRDWALMNGDPWLDPATEEPFYEVKTITVVAPFCVESTNPSGKTPQAPGTGQNEDGFYLIGAEPADFEVYLLDDGSGTVFGPFTADTDIKYTETLDQPPAIQEMGANNGNGNGNGNQVEYHIWGYGDAVVFFIDDFDNLATASCLVPPPPK